MSISGNAQPGEERVQDVISLSEYSSPRNADLDPQSRVAAIVNQLEHLAKEASANDAPAATSPKFVRRVLAARAARREFFEAELFADPAWDILLELYALKCEQRRISVSKLSVAAAVPSTTALRWIDKLHNDGLIERSADPLDARRIWVSMSDSAFSAMQSYLGSLAAHSVPL